MMQGQDVRQDGKKVNLYDEDRDSSSLYTTLKWSVTHLPASEDSAVVLELIIISLSRNSVTNGCKFTTIILHGP